MPSAGVLCIQDQGSPETSASSPKPLGTWSALKPRGGTVYELCDGAIREEDEDSMQQSYTHSCSQPHTGQVLLSAPTP